jgi:hypothetical protein
MIFYGSRARRLKDGKVNNVTCPCERKELTSMTYSVFGKYAHIYWIPLFPLGKSNVLECDHCKKTFKLKNTTGQIQSKFETEKHRGVPIFHFTGIIIIVLLIFWAFYQSSATEEKELEYLAQPQIGDVYRTEGSNSSYYTTAKVTEIVGDSIYLIFNEYEVNKRSAVHELDIPNNYKIENTEGFLLEEIKGLYEENIIYQIDRD